MRATHDPEKLVRQKWRLLNPTMDERQRRVWAGAEAGAIGFGGVAAVARATGLAISTVRKGRDEGRAGAKPSDVVKVRRSAGPRHFEELHPEVWPALEKLVDPATRGDPESPLRWTCKSTHVLAAELFAQHGIRISDKTVAKLLRDHDYSLQAPRRLPRFVLGRRTRRPRASSIRIATRSSSTSTRLQRRASNAASQ